MCQKERHCEANLFPIVVSMRFCLYTITHSLGVELRVEQYGVIRRDFEGLDVRASHAAVFLGRREGLR